jgi:hypothetical protein
VSTAILEAQRFETEAVAAPKTIHAENLATATEKLAALRFLIILTARWESSDGTEPERREQLGMELVRLRKQYSDKIDEIAMQHSVQAAMDAKDDVERTVTVPRTARLPMRPEPGIQVWF